MDQRLRWIRFYLLVLALVAPLTAQEAKLALRAAFEPATAKPGDQVTLVLSATVADGWHAYGTLEKVNMPVKLDHASMRTGGLELLGPASIPPGKPYAGPIGTQFPLPNAFAVKQALKVPATQAAGEVTVEGALTYQVCDANSCLMPLDAAFVARLTIVASPPPPTGNSLKPPLMLEPDEKVVITAAFVPPTVRAGERTKLVLDVTVDERYHAYGTKEKTNTPVALDVNKLDLGVLEAVGGAHIPPGELKQQFGMDSYPLPHRFQVTQELAVPAGTAPGAIQVEGVLDYQVCDENSCDPAAEGEFRATLTIEAGEARAAVESIRSGGAGTSGTMDIASDNPFTSWWALILACIGGGLFALAMPCTYPMIPITFSFFTKQAEKRGGNVLPLALVYGFGIIAMFVLVGVGLSSVIIDVVNHWVTNTIIGVLFVFFAFVLFGWVNLNPPQFLQRAAGKASATGGLLGVFFMGATLVITSFTCTAPIVGSLIANVAKVGTFRVGIGMAVFGLTMALPFVWLSLMPGKVKSMPRSGEWMETLKVSLGFVELAAALKFLSMVDFALGWQILPRELFLLLWTTIFGLWAMYLFGFLRKAGTPNEGVGAGRMASGMFVALLATYFFFGALGNRLDSIMTGFVPAYSSPLASHRGADADTKQVAKHTIVYDDPDQALAKAKAEGKLLLYNFTGFN